MSPSSDRVSAPAIGYRYAFGFTAAVVLLFVGLAAFGQWRGLSTRHPGVSSGVVVVDDSKQLLSAWDESGVHGAVLVEASEQFGFQAVTFESLGVPAKYPVVLDDVRKGFRLHLQRDNRLWVASENGMFRTIHYVMEPNAFRLRLEQGRQMGYSGIAADGKSITPNLNGYLRTIQPVLPSLNETAVLDVDASYFKSGRPADLANSIRRSGLEFSMITLNRALDDTTTPAAARARLDEFGRLIGQPR